MEVIEEVRTLEDKIVVVLSPEEARWLAQDGWHISHIRTKIAQILLRRGERPGRREEKA